MRNDKDLYKTFDNFHGGKGNDVIHYLGQCREIASKCGLTTNIDMSADTVKLYLLGTKKQFMKYYFRTAMKLKGRERLSDLKRFLHVFTW